MEVLLHQIKFNDIFQVEECMLWEYGDVTLVVILAFFSAKYTVNNTILDE